MFGTVQERCSSRNGKPQLKINGKYIFVGRCNTDGIDKGSQVEYETNTFGDGGKLTGLLSIRLAQPNGAPRSNGSQAPSPASFFDGDELRFISNVVGSAIMAKSAASPTDVKGWALAAREALEALKGAPAQRTEHPFNDDLPPDESENPAPPQNNGARRW